MSKIIYIGPTIIGVATRNTVYDGIPESLKAATEIAPYMAGLCVPVSALAEATVQIRNRSGAYFNLYQKALRYSATKGEK